MTTTSYPKVWLNGVSLEDENNNRYGLDPSTPPRVVNMPAIQSVRVPGRDGSLQTPLGAHPSPLFTVVVLVAGKGNTPDELFADTESIIEMLGANVAIPRVAIWYHVSSVVQRIADARISSFDVTRPRLDYAVVTIVLELLTPFWYDAVSASTVSLTVSGGWARLPSQFVGTAPILDSVITISGPATNPRVTDNGSGDWFYYNGAVGSGQSLVFDAFNLRATLDGARVDHLVTVGGSGAYVPSAFRIAPYNSVPGDPFSGAAALAVSGASQVKVQGRRAFR